MSEQPHDPDDLDDLAAVDAEKRAEWAALRARLVRSAQAGFKTCSEDGCRGIPLQTRLDTDDGACLAHTNDTEAINRALAGLTNGGRTLVHPRSAVHPGSAGVRPKSRPA
jgi:hypothetical protein